MSGALLSDEQRARAAASRRRARALRAARSAAPAPAPAAAPGGFLAEDGERAREAPPAAAPPAPVLDPAERPECVECGRRFASSHLWDAFEYAACDGCRDDDGAHALVARTEAKAEYLLRDEDLDSRFGALRCVRRRNPHAPRGDMRLYLRAQVEERALRVWGSEARLDAELEARAARRAEGRARRDGRRLRALRLAVRSSLAAAPRAAHAHVFGEETYDAAADAYSRACACGHTETYEKM